MPLDFYTVKDGRLNQVSIDFLKLILNKNANKILVNDRFADTIQRVTLIFFWWLQMVSWHYVGLNLSDQF